MFNTLQSFKHGKFHSLPALAKQLNLKLERLPVSIRIVLESVLRNCDGKKVTEEHVRQLAGWQPNAKRTEEIPFVLARILLQDFTGVPLLCDLAAMRGVAARMGKDPKVVEPLVPVEPARAVALAAAGRFPLVRRFVARRLTEDVEKTPAHLDALLKVTASEKSADFQLDVLGGMTEALRGWRKARPPEAWAELQKKLASSTDKRVREQVRDLAVVFGDGRALDELRRIALNNNADGEARVDSTAKSRADQEAMSEESLDDSEDGSRDRLDRDAESAQSKAGSQVTKKK